MLKHALTAACMSVEQAPDRYSTCSTVRSCRSQGGSDVAGGVCQIESDKYRPRGFVVCKIESDNR